MLLLTDDLQDGGCCKQRKSSDWVHCLAGSPQPYTARHDGTAWVFPLLGQGMQNCDWSWLWWYVPDLGGYHQISEYLQPSKFWYVPGRRLVTLYTLSRDVGAVLYPTLWATFTLRDVLSIVRASGAEDKGLFWHPDSTEKLFTRVKFRKTVSCAWRQGIC